MWNNRYNNKSTQRQRGFTLLELLIAISIFALISVMAFSGLRSTQNTTEKLTEAEAALADLQMMMLLMERDIQQSVDRKVRDSFGQEQSAFVGARAATGSFLEFTRDGARNPTGQPRSNLQRVAYAVQDDKLVRMVWSALDRSYGAEPAETELLSGVKAVEVRYMDQSRSWQDQWPPLVPGGSAPPPAIPIAVEVTLDLERWGKLPRLFRTAGEAPVWQDTEDPVAGTGGGGPGKPSDDKKKK